MIDAARNAILASLSAEQWAYWEPYFFRAEHQPGERVASAGAHAPYLWFPTSGVYCLTFQSRDGACVDVAVIGREGVVGLPAFFGIPWSLQCTTIVKTAHALAIDASGLAGGTRDEPTLHQRLMAYAGIRLASMPAIAACNRIHRLEQRFCRWLLDVCTRAETNVIPITQDLVALILGTRRASVTDMINDLDRRGALAHSRGRLIIRDMSLVRQCACECYAALNAAMEFPERP